MDFFSLLQSNALTTCISFELLTKVLTQKIIRSFSKTLKICHTNGEMGQSLNSILIKEANPSEADFYVTFLNPLIKNVQESAPRDDLASNFKDPQYLFLQQ